MPERFAERVMHVDMDAFYVEVERLRRPDLRGVPVVVGGLGPRGVVASASYEARAHGIRSAMPIGQARRLCPTARFVPPDHEQYREMSAGVFEVFGEFSPLVEGLSVDEAFLDIGGLRLHHESPRAVGEGLRAALRDRLALPASVGIATTKLLAKLGSEEAKPDGLLVIPAGDELAFLHPLPVRRLWGVGEATLAGLEGLGVRTIGDLAAVPERTLVGRLGPSLGAHLAGLAAGRDDRDVTPGGSAKSISVEETYSTDLTGRDRIESELLRHCDRLSSRLRRAGMEGRTVTVKIRYDDFSTITRSHTEPEAIHATPDLWRVVAKLAREADLDRPVRLLGVGSSGLTESGGPHQMRLDRPGHLALVEAADRIRERFGDDAVVPGSLSRPGEAPDPGTGATTGTRDDRGR